MLNLFSKLDNTELSVVYNSIIDNVKDKFKIDIDKVIEYYRYRDHKVANNNILVVTEQDNLVHNYFYYFECSFDAVDCLSTAIIKLPKMNEENTNYWVTYTGYLLIYLGASVKYDEVNPASNAQTKNLNASNSELSSVTPPTNTENAVNERYFNTQNKLPFFKGKISRVKEKESSIELYVDNIGVRFKQKISHSMLKCLKSIMLMTGSHNDFKIKRRKMVKNLKAVFPIQLNIQKNNIRFDSID